MNTTVSLLFGVHAHQPAGNFPAVFDHAHRLCYRPFFETVHRHPAFRFAVHFSGPLLDYLLDRYPDDMRLLTAMVARGQVEMFGAGETEPVLAAIPERDRIGQIDALSGKLDRLFGARPSGAWLTERVWESTVVPSLAQCGIRYVTVDDYHFLCAGQAAAALHGYFTTEEGGRSLDLFPISEALRYRIPFAPAAEAVAYIESLGDAQGRKAAIYFDDIEKFGIWPETHEWVYGQQWLERFILGVLGSPRIVPRTFRDQHAAQPTRGIVYLPTTSYIEMNEWTLPAPAAQRYAELVAREKAAGRYDDDKAFVRGGIWKNFLSRYPEANWMHKRMLGASRRLADLPEARQTERLRRLLYLSQANDAYWHGLFGGLYLPHLRRGVYRALLELEAALDAIAPRPVRYRMDLDSDGCDELVLRSDALQAVVKLDGAASIVELDAYALAQNFGDVLRRQTEHYHAKAGAAQSASTAAGGIASAHDRVSFKHEIRPEDLEVDETARTTFRDRWVDPQGKAHPLSAYALAPEVVAGPSAGFTTACGGGAVAKRIAVTGRTLTVSYTLDGVGGGTLQTELNLAMPSCDGYAGRYILRGDIPCGFGQPLDAEEVAELALDDRFMGGAVFLRCNPPASVRARPLHTVSQSEEGFEKIMQCAVVTLAWPVVGDLRGDLRTGQREFVVTLEVTPDG